MVSSEATTGLPVGDRRGTFGPGALADLPGLVSDLRMRRLLLLTGRGSFTASGADAVLAPLREVAEVRTWSDFATNPTVEDLLVGIGLVRDLGPDGIVAIGGGSVLDMAKLLAAFGDLDPSAVPDAIRGNTVAERSRSLVLVPTTSGSGSEATHFAVVYIGTEKYSVAHPSLLPDAVVLDPVLTESAAPHQKATSVIDAVAQAVESHWARSADDISRRFAREALKALAPSAQAFVDGDSAAAVEAARGSHLAGRAIDLSKTTGAHAMAYGLTKRHGISHGHAVAVTLGGFARRHAAASRTDVGLRADLDAIAGLIGADGPDAVGDRLDDLAGDLGLELRLSALGVPREDLAVMAAAVNHERLGNNPVALSPAELTRLLEDCW